MNLKHLSHDRLTNELLGSLKAERTAMTKFLHYLCEFEDRRLYAKEGFSSLFQYCVSHLKFSEPEAARRVNAARALREMPELASKIDSGELNLTTVSQAQVSFKREAKSGNKVSTEKKREILKQLENKTCREAEKILISHSSSPEQSVRERIRPVSENLSELVIGADNELLENLEFLKDLWGLPNHTEVIKKMAKICRKQSPKPRTPAPESKPGTRHIQAHVKREVRLRDQNCCTYVNKETGKRCNSHHGLQFDHIIPFAQGGANTVENLRLRCPAHNQWHAMESYGPEVLRYWRRA